MLEYRVRDLTGDGVARLGKPLGVPGRPYPMRYSATVQNDKGESVQIQRIGLLEDNARPLRIFSDRSYAEVFGMAYREMPSPSMLPIFYDALNLRRPDSKRYIQYYKGAPGTGKTYMSELIGRIRDPRGPIVVNCGDKNLAELVYETVLDFDRGRDFYDELQNRLHNNALKNPLSLIILREHLGPALIASGDSYTINWDAIGETVKDHQSGHAERQNGGDKKALVQHAIAGFEMVRALENLSDLGGNALGMATQEGPLIRAWREGREIVLDEYNKRKQGSDGGLHRLIQFFAGSYNECLVENTLKEKGEEASQSFLFRQEDRRAGFFVSMTGNDETDGETTFALSESLHSRVPPQKIPVATVEDWQHRICQMMTGMPVSTIYRSDSDRWDKNPEAFGAWLQKVRMVGLSEDEKSRVPKHHMRLLDRWQDVLAASEKMANFYHGWSKIVDPNSELARSGQLSKLMMEIDDIYKSEVSVDFRRISEHLEEALEFRARVKSPDDSQGYTDMDIDSQPEGVDMSDLEDPVERFGSRLADVIIQHVRKTTIDIGKPQLFKQIMKHAEDCGIIPANLIEAKASASKTLAQLLDEDLYDDRNIRQQASFIRRHVCDALKRNHGLSDIADDDIVTEGMVQATLQSFENEGLQDIESAEWQGSACESRELVVGNDDPETVSGQPLKIVNTIDPVGTDIPGPDADLLLRERDFLATLVMPRIGEHNLRSIWNRAISRSGLVAPGSGGDVDRSVAIAEGAEQENMRITTVMVARNDGKASVPLHVIWNRASNRALIVGDEIDHSLKESFSRRGITFVARNETNAELKVRVAFVKSMGIADADEGRLKSAFLLRNCLPSASAESTATLSQMLVGRETRTLNPNYILNHMRNPIAKAA